MKKIIKYITVVLFASGFLNSCETTDLDLRVSPNDLAANQADPNLILNSIQLAYVSNQVVFSNRAAEVTRINYMSGRNYFNRYPGQTLSTVWARVYSSEFNTIGSTDPDVGMWTNIEALKEIDANSDINYAYHIAVGQTLKAHSLIQLTDFIGSAVFSQAGNPDEFPAPMLDSGQDVYAGALALLDEAEALFNGPTQTTGVNDFFYAGDKSKWLKVINTIRLQAYVNTGNTAAFNAIIAGGNYIATVDDDFQYQFGTRQLQPDTRHPSYADDYTPSGANIHKSNWLMEQMLNNDDPRIRYYFYRQTDETPGSGGADPNEERLACSFDVPPPHYDGIDHYCGVPNGYWGRAHGNDQGIPPDNFFRTAFGVYPAAGRFDDDSFGNVGLGEGGGGAGIQPIFLASQVDFWRAEMATSDAEKAQFLESALEKSIAKVQSFGGLDSNADASFAPTPAEVTAFIDAQVAAYNAASGTAKQNILAEQYFVSLYGGSTDAYNYYRRTGFPTTLSPNWEANPGPFPRSFLFPQNEVITNPNLDQKDAMTQQVFWDTNPAGPAFPPAN